MMHGIAFNKDIYDRLRNGVLAAFHDYLRWPAWLSGEKMLIKINRKIREVFNKARNVFCHALDKIEGGIKTQDFDICDFP